jgi:hypothetical protein
VELQGREDGVGLPKHPISSLSRTAASRQAYHLCPEAVTSLDRIADVTMEQVIKSSRNLLVVSLSNDYA